MWYVRKLTTNKSKHKLYVFILVLHFSYITPYVEATGYIVFVQSASMCQAAIMKIGKYDMIVNETLSYI